MALTHPDGFTLWRHTPRRWSAETRRRIETFVDALRLAGYRVELRPTGRGAARYFLIGFDPRYGSAFTAAAAFVERCEAADRLLAELTADELSVASGLAEGWGGSVEELIAVCRRVDAQGIRSAFP